MRTAEKRHTPQTTYTPTSFHAIGPLIYSFQRAETVSSSVNSMSNFKPQIEVELQRCLSATHTTLRQTLI